MRRLASVALATICLVPLACGDDDDSPDPAAERADAREAVAAFETAVDDEGFVPSDDDDDDEDGFEFTSEECKELDAVLSDEEDLPGETVKEESGEFKRTEDAAAQETVQGSVTFANDDALQGRLEIFDDERTAGCIEEGLETVFANQESTAELELRDIVVEIERRDLGDDAVHLQTSAVIAAPGIELPFSLELLAVRSGRRGVTVMTTGIGMDSTLDLPALADVLLTGSEAT